jgi:methylated-DNA-[protein]-cysteine S-methyltransferase
VKKRLVTGPRLTISTLDSPLGPIGFAVLATGELARVWFDFESATELWAAIHASLGSASSAGEEPEFNDAASVDLVRRFRRFAEGRRVSFAGVSLDLVWTTPFQRRVIEQAQSIPYGKTLTYGQLAERAGYAGAARAVGSVMARNRFPLVVPCHRVVASGNRLGGFSSRRGISTKQRLLELERASNEKGALV